MRKTINFTEAKQENKQLRLYSSEEVDLHTLEAAEQVIVDSDKLSFVYLAEDSKEYVYLYLPQIIWKELKLALQNNLEVVVISGQTSLVLEQIHNELQYLIENIEGNSNYGDELVSKVEEMFIR
ncbi:hypothetical protein WAK64_05665 [Bacillus spongiae]|uniref:Uncharacterized protein n=1 Tax=Bacillus spongiae TaxID=2683610 RepID=A0ABU8HB62_9BACI